MLYIENYDIVLITESWLNPNCCSALLDPESKYTVLRKDRDNIGGGVCALIKRNVSVVHIQLDKKYDRLELICFDILYFKTKLRVFVMYRAPYSDEKAVEYLELLIDCFNTFTVNSHTNIIVGDLNCSKIN